MNFDLPVLFSAFAAASIWWEELGQGVFHNLEGRNILFLVGNDFDWHETIEMQKYLEGWKATVKFSGNRQEITGHKKEYIEGKKKIVGQERIIPHLRIEEIDIASWDLFFIPGGKGPENLLKEDKEKILKFIYRANSANKPIAAICHGPLLLAEAGIVKGRNVTGHLDIKQSLKEGGSIFHEGEKIVIDGNLITANSPYFASCAKAIARMILKR